MSVLSFDFYIECVFERVFLMPLTCVFNLHDF